MKKNKLLDEELKNVAGGSGEQSLKGLYYFNQYLKALQTKYDAWLGDRADVSDEEKLIMAKYFTEEVHNRFTIGQRQLIDGYVSSMGYTFEKIAEDLARSK